MKKIRWGVLGTARIALNSMIPAIGKSSNGQVVCIASRNAKKASQAAAQCGVARSCGSYEQLLADKEIDAVYIPLPVNLHAEWSIKAAQAGKHVLCEKPLCANAAEAREMAAAFESRGLLLMEAFMYRFHPVTVEVKRMVDEGEVGQVRTIRVSFAAGVDDDSDIRLNPLSGGGALLDIGCYCVDVMRFLTGEEPGQVASVAHVGQKSGVDESTAGAVRFDSGIVGYFGCSFRSQYDSSYDIIGSTGRILVDFGAMCHWPDAEFKIKHWKGNDYNEIVIPPANHYTLLAEEFCSAVLDKRPPRYSLQSSVANMVVIDRIRASATPQNPETPRARPTQRRVTL